MPNHTDALSELSEVDSTVTVADRRWSNLLGVPDLAGAGQLLRPVIAATLTAGGWTGPAELGVVLADDATVRALNYTYRQVDQPTNVLSFALEDTGEPRGPGPVALGDVVLAFETVAGEAASQGLRPDDHLRHLVVHGILHLIGYDHQEDVEAESMERLEALVLVAFGIADPYAVPTDAGAGRLP